MSYLETIGKNAKKAFEDLKGIKHKKIKKVLDNYNQSLLNNTNTIIKENLKDVKNVKRKQGNKSEMAVGYATLYGDLVGGFALLKDVYKADVYNLAKYRNSISEVIPQNTIDKEPSAELSENQFDSDSLPNYDTLDKIIKLYIEEDYSSEKIINSGIDKDVVYDVLEKIDRNEYKRNQVAPGVKLTNRAFGKDRRMPITNTYKRERN